MCGRFRPAFHPLLWILRGRHVSPAAADRTRHRGRHAAIRLRSAGVDAEAEAEIQEGTGEGMIGADDLPCLKLHRFMEHLTVSIIWDLRMQ